MSRQSTLAVVAVKVEVPCGTYGHGATIGEITTQAAREGIQAVRNIMRGKGRVIGDPSVRTITTVDASDIATYYETDLPAAGSRLDRQGKVHGWCRAAFGDDHAQSVKQRGVRMAEEAIEAAQACNVDPAMLHKLIDHIYSKPVGNLPQEIGGVGVTLLALAQAATIDADAEEVREFERVLSIPLAHFAARNAAKNAAGFDVTGDNP